MRNVLLGLMVVAGLSGCAAGSAAKFAKVLGNDKAIFVINAGTPYGTQKIVRIGETTNSVTVTPEGQVTVNSNK